MDNYYEVEKVIPILNEGGLILYPTDTIWGIGCDATNPDAVQRIKDLKKRNGDKTNFVLLVDSIDMLKEYVTDLHPRLETLLFYHTRPLTVVYEGIKNLPTILLSENNSAAIRITHDPFCQQIISEFGRPVVATAANVQDDPYPTHFGLVRSDIIQGVDYVVRHRQKERHTGEPSVIVRFSADEELEVVRE